jgi:hypothetical protein
LSNPDPNGGVGDPYPPEPVEEPINWLHRARMFVFVVALITPYVLALAWMGSDATDSPDITDCDWTPDSAYADALVVLLAIAGISACWFGARRIRVGEGTLRTLTTVFAAAYVAFVVIFTAGLAVGVHMENHFFICF